MYLPLSIMKYQYHNDITYKRKDLRNNIIFEKGWKVCTVYKCLFGLFGRWNHTPGNNLYLQKNKRNIFTMHNLTCIHTIQLKKAQIENKCIIGILMYCRCVNGQIKSHQRAIWVLHKIPQDLFCKNHACSDMSSRHLVCCLYILQHICLLLFVCSH